jgi:aryl-alcohol dehydrogenase-like predicted oxidoreductase
MDSVDLYYVHRMHPKVPVEEQAVAMKSVLDAGLCKHVGLSEFAPHNIRAFHSICPVTCVQQEWSLVNRDLEVRTNPTECCAVIEQQCLLSYLGATLEPGEVAEMMLVWQAELVPCCRDLGIGIVAYSPLCRSLLSGEVASVEDLTGGEDDMRPAR